MKIIFITAWSINDPLTLSTVFPNIQLLSENPEVKSIHLITIERDKKLNLKKQKFNFPSKVIHIQINEKSGYLCKILTVIKSFMLISKLRKNSISLIISRSSIAAIPALFASVLYRMKFTVESYEPHSNYMKDNGEWNKYGLKYNFLKLIEIIIENRAYRIYPVAEYFKKLLLHKGLPKDKVSLMPCSVNPMDFAYNSKKREKIRSKLKISNDTITGINVGKFGGIYHDDDAFIIFNEAKKAFAKFHLILLSHDNHSIIEEKLKYFGLDEDDFTIMSVDQSEVSHYLSAADFAFALIKTTKSSKASSAVKIGEYYASGLPIAITQDIGDDSYIITNENAGEILDLNGDNNFRKINILIKENDHRNRISTLASKYRSPNINFKNYHKLVKDIFLGQKE